MCTNFPERGRTMSKIDLILTIRKEFLDLPTDSCKKLLDEFSGRWYFMKDLLENLAENETSR